MPSQLKMAAAAEVSEKRKVHNSCSEDLVVLKVSMLA